MTQEERIKIYNEATDLWGLVAQYDQCIEEMAELTVAINKYKRKVIYGEYANSQEIIDNLIEEIADVKICIEQMCWFFKDYNIDAMLDNKMVKFKNQIDKMKNVNN